MHLTEKEEKMLNGEEGYAVKKAMQILVALGDIYGAERLIKVGSVQVAGVSYHNLGDAGLEYLNELAEDGKVKVLTTLNPAGMDLENWQQLGISKEFAEKQNMVIDAFEKMGILISCTCTPYLIGNLPRYGEHVAWSESSAVTFANSVIGAKTNREGGEARGSKCLLISSRAEERLKLTITRFFSLIFFNRSMSRRTSWDLVRICTGKSFSLNSSSTCRVSLYFFSMG